MDDYCPSSPNLYQEIPVKRCTSPSMGYRSLSTKCCPTKSQFVKTNGFSSNAGRYKILKVLAMIILFLFFTVHFVWGANNLGVNIDDQNGDRYFTLEFWRLAASGLDSLPMLFFAFMFMCPKQGWLRNVTCIMLFFFILIDLASFGWFIWDVCMCGDVPHCDGAGTGGIILGIDIAFLVMIGTLIVRLVLMVFALIILYQLKILHEKHDVYFKSFKIEPVSVDC